MWGNLSRGIYKPYADIIGGNTSERGYQWLREQMILGREPVHMRDHSVIWKADLINNPQPMTFDLNTCWTYVRRPSDSSLVLNAVEQHFADVAYHLVSRLILGTLPREEYDLLGSGDEGIFFVFCQYGFA